MNCSLNETEALARKAARGAGYSWGQAEDAGKAVRWACRYTFDAVSSLEQLLAQIDQCDLSQWCPQTTLQRWTAADGVLCPLLTGMVLADNACRHIDARTEAHLSTPSTVVNTGRAEVTKPVHITMPVHIGKILQPVLLFYFVATTARRLGVTLTVTGDSFTLYTDGDRSVVDGMPGGVADNLMIAETCDVERAPVTCTRAIVDAASWSGLSAYAQRTYAPATDHSRLGGAGAGLNDND